MSTVGVVLSTVEGVQYHGDIMMHVGGYHEYRVSVQYREGKIFCYLSTPWHKGYKATCNRCGRQYNHGFKWKNDGLKKQRQDSLLSWINHGRYDRFCEAASEEEPKSFHISCRYERFIL